MTIRVKRAFRLKPETNTLLNTYVADTHSNGSTTYGAYSNVVDAAISTHCTTTYDHNDHYTGHENALWHGASYGVMDICKGCPHKEPHK